jgi:hypothetical protein
MKLKLLSILLVLPFALFAQNNDSLESRFLLNFVIPDMPAYKSLGIEKSDLLRPSDVKDFAVMLNPFLSNGKGVIPKNFGLEFAPWKMASKKWTLKDYEDKGGKRMLYNSSFSLATVSDSTAYPSKISMGYRFAILSKNSDIIRIAYSKKSDFAQKAQDASVLKRNFSNYWITKVVKPLPPPAERPEYVINHETEFYNWLASLNTPGTTMSDELETLVDETKRIFGDDFSFDDFKKSKFDDVESTLLDKLILEYKNKNWNASRFDAAIAWVGESSDSLVSNARFSSFNVWATEAIKVGKRGQLLIGGNLKIPNSSVDSMEKSPFQFSLSSRLLIGNGHFRFFGEAQWKKCNFGTIENSVLLNIGAEMRISQKFWLVASSGVDNLKAAETTKWQNRLVANLDLRYGFNF